MFDFPTYKAIVEEDIRRTLAVKRCQPVLFVGSGLSRRYVNLPDWHGLLSEISRFCPLITKDYAFYQQTMDSAISIGTMFSDLFHEWAWGAGRKDFPPELFQGAVPRDTFLKYVISEYINMKMADFDITNLPDYQQREIEAIKSIKPDSLITTNYDTLLENIFPEYNVVIGQQVIRTDDFLAGEIFKIHGSITDIHSLVLNDSDYLDFRRKKKYLVAKLLTLFTEHPLIFIGYSVDDPNVKEILSDIDEILAPVGALIPNIYFLQRDENAENLTDFAAERLISIDDRKSVRVKNIVASEFTWVFNALASDSPLEQVSPRLMRAFIARMHEMVRSDIPRRRFEINLKGIQDALTTTEGIPQLFGIAMHSGGTSAAIDFPFTTAMVADQLGVRLHIIYGLVKRIEAEKGINIRATDNIYYWDVKTGMKATSRSPHYSKEAIELFRKILAGEEYEVQC